jgi:DNA polymerase III epsilon subunit-like protein
MSVHALSLAETTFVVLDLETSGAAPSTGAAITEIGALKVRGGEIIGENHRALDDARATVDVLHGIFERLGSHNVTTLEDLMQFKRKRPRRPID